MGVITTFLVDDEPLARSTLHQMITAVPWTRHLGEAADGFAAVESINALAPDVVFLDIQMPGLSGLEVVERLTGTPCVVFTTAYDEHAVAAFELEACDYLVKPFGRRRFLSALERARRNVEARRGTDVLARARSALTGLARAAGTAPLDRILVRDSGALVLVPVAEIQRVEAEDDYVRIFAAGQAYLASIRMGELQERLESPPFLRVHRSHLVNLDFVVRMVPYDGSRLQLVLRDGSRILASRSGSRDIRRMGDVQG
jgi:two-component system, LytTR family, response regulator